MKKYINPEQQRYRYYVRESANGFAIQVLNVDRDENIPLSPPVASQLGVQLPDGYRIQCCTRQAAEKELERLATLNGWAPLE